MDDLINLFNILSDKTRLRILLLLIKNELCVCEIFAALDMSQPRVSRQLAILKHSRIIKDRRVGKWIYYSIDDNEYTRLLKDIFPILQGWLKNDKEYLNDKSMLSKISELKVNCELTLSGGDNDGR
ncbi:MAG: metalloregulator ArsR/SmtB family transcription factor [Bacillota bacterium]|nr:metalloregulator ArsR/SmtB family transcription factor [Bacillota bacterium]